jgi:hypothetical protein
MEPSVWKAGSLASVWSQAHEEETSGIFSLHRRQACGWRRHARRLRKIQEEKAVVDVKATGSLTPTSTQPPVMTDEMFVHLCREAHENRNRIARIIQSNFWIN